MSRHQNPRKTSPKSPSKVTILAGIFGVAALIVSTSLPAAMFDDADSSFALSQPNKPLQDSRGTQSFTTGAAVAITTPATVGRDGYAVSLPPPPPPPRKVAQQSRLASFAPTGSLLYTPNPNGAIQWPFKSYVPIASGFGSRPAPCGGCSSFHNGLDFLPGAGAPIGAIAPGVVSAATSSSGGFGTHVVVDHVVNGQNVQSVYAHMIAGSPRVAVGDTVVVGQTLGLVGSTGASTGAHLHLGISIDGTDIDPFAWLSANTN